MTTERVIRAREAFAQRAWDAAYTEFTAEPDRATLSLDDIEAQAVAANLLGRGERAREALAEGYRAAMRAGDKRRAARFAFWT